MYKSFNCLISFFIASSSFFCASAQSQSNVATGNTDQTYVSVLTTGDFHQATTRNDVVWPKDKIKANAAKGLFIEEIVVTPTGYEIIYNKNYSKQIINEGLSFMFIQEGKEQGYALTEICNSPQGLMLVMSDVPNSSGYDYIIATTLNEILTKVKTSKKQLFKIAYSDSGFIGLTRTSVGNNDQKIYNSKNFPSDWINGQVKAGYALTDIFFHAGQWYVLMSAESQKSTSQYMVSKTWEPKKQWDLGKRFTHLVYSYDFYAAKKEYERLYKLGNADFDSKRKEAGFAKYDQALVTFPYGYFVYYLRGFRNFYEEKYEASIKDYSLLIDKFNRTDAGYYMHRGVSYSKTKKFELAVKDFDEFLKLKTQDKDKITVLTEAVEAQRQLGNPKDALVYLDQLIKLKPSDEDFKFLRTELLKSPEQNKPTIVWDAPFNATTTVQGERLNISACVYLKGQKLKSYKILLNGKEVPVVGKRGLTIEEVCDQKIEQNISLVKGDNVLEIILFTDKYEIRSEKRRIIFQQNQVDKKVDEQRNPQKSPVDNNKPSIVWDAPFHATSTVQTERLKISACVYLKGQNMKSFRILLNNQEVSFVGRRGSTVEENCDLSIDQHVSLRKGENIVEIIVITDKSELRSEKRKIIYK